ncbi:MAG: ATP-dependent helicase/nuclease subunit A [Polyangiales bacterium]|jgi:ATP-dependent helicase/nuclease subunit A
MNAPMNEQDFPDYEARCAIREDLDTTFLVEAAAGTGKTTELIHRILRVIATGRGRIEEIVAVTFTDKAAGELKLRLRRALEGARAHAEDSEERGRFEAAIAGLELAALGTIHSFCGDLLREFPVEAGIDPLFETASEGEAEALMQDAFQGWFESVLSDPPRAVERILRGVSYNGPREQLWSAAKKVIERRDFAEPWPIPKGDYVEGMDALVTGMLALGEYATKGKSGDPLVGYLEQFHATAANLRSGEFAPDALASTNDWAEGVLRDFAKGNHWVNKGFRDEAFGDKRSEAIRGMRTELHSAFKLWLKRADAHLAATLKEALEEVVALYEDTKRREGVLDYLDLLLKTRALLDENASVRAAFQKRFTHVFIDEFQDTDPRQTEILWTLATASDGSLTPGKLFVVGDPKQAIYRFRRADIGVYDHAKARLQAAGAKLVHLRTSFRARPHIQKVLNQAFAEEFGEGEAGVQAAHVPLAPARLENPSQPSCVVLPITHPWGRWGGSFWLDSGPEECAAYADWLLTESGWTVEGTDGLRRIAPEDICFLMTRMKSGKTDIAAQYTAALEARGIPHVLVAGRAFHEREEVMAFRAVLGAIEWPGDRLRVYAALRGPYFALSDALLLAWRGFAHHFDPLVETQNVPAELQPVADALRALAELHVLRNHRPAAETCTEFLERTRAHTALILAPSGIQVLANATRVVQLARRHDQDRRQLSFRAFVEALDVDATDGGRRDSVLLEEGSGGVRLMTVHSAKGLEFPIVFLCDAGATLKYDRPDHYADHAKGSWATELAGAVSGPLLQHRKESIAQARAETVRKLYVASTRARDLLVIPGIGDYLPGHNPPNFWVLPLMKVTTPPHEVRKGVRKAPGCPVFEGEDTVLHRPGKASVHEGVHVRPGLQANGVVWWDPSALKLEVPRREGLRGASLLKADGPASAQGRKEHETFKAAAAALRESARAPTIRARTVTEASKLEARKGRAVTIVSTEASQRSRPSGPRFGTLVHAILGDSAFGAGGDEIAQQARFHARALGATDAELQAAIDAATDAFTHPILERAAASADARREVSLVHRQVDGAILEGIADLVFHEADPFGGGGWVVVDFKTDLADDVRDAYLVQIELYAEAVEAATGETCQGILLGV